MGGRIKSKEEGNHLLSSFLLFLGFARKGSPVLSFSEIQVDSELQGERTYERTGHQVVGVPRSVLHQVG